MKVFIAKYEDHMYPEDNKILGVYTNDRKAEDAIFREIIRHRDTKFPKLHLSNRLYYDIEEFELDLGDAELPDGFVI